MAKGAATWKRVKFGEITQCVNDRVDDPKSAGVDRYVGLEHLDPESLAIRRWGTPDDVESTKLRFKPGDIIFGKRRAYQRKLGVADFEGICSAHAMVLRAKPDAVVPEFLPFFMQSDLFMERAIAISVGSLSPTINWKTLAAEEFALPPLEEQRRLVVPLNGCQRVVEAHRQVAQSHEALFGAAVVREFLPDSGTEWLSGNISDSAIPAGWRLVRAEDLSTDLVTKGATPAGEHLRPDGGVPFLKVYNLTFDGRLDFAHDPTWISEEAHRALRRSAVLSGDVLMNIVGPPLGKVSRVPPGFAESNINQAIVRYRPRSTILGDWLETYLLSPVAQNWLLRRSKKTSGQRNLTLELCRDLPVPLPEDPERVLERVHALRRVRVACRVRLMEARQMSMVARNHLLRPPVV